MKHTFESLFSHFVTIIRSKYFLGALGILLIAFVLYSRSSTANQEETIFPKEGLLIQSVKVTGPVTPTSEAMLSFEKTGAVSSINVGVGNKVYAGQVLATLSNDDLCFKQRHRLRIKKQCLNSCKLAQDQKSLPLRCRQ